MGTTPCQLGLTFETGGERFLFGQTNQGIHHGIRNGGYLHSAHWGADWNASTNLNDYLPQDDDGWIHALVYDGAIDEAHMILMVNLMVAYLRGLLTAGAISLLVPETMVSVNLLV